MADLFWLEMQVLDVIFWTVVGLAAILIALPALIELAEWIGDGRRP